MSKAKDVKKVVLAYSGGLDTSIILKWLQTELGAEVVTFTADLGQGGELEPARRKAEMMGIKDIRVVDVREEFVSDFVFPMFRANTVYEGTYLLGTSIARPLISKHLVEIARETGADAIAHGATGKGNDQVRFELSAYALNPDIKVIAPWRDWSFKSRTDLIELRRAAPDSGAEGQEGRRAVLGRRQPSALLLRGQGAGGPVDASRRNSSTSAPFRRWMRPTPSPRSRSNSSRAIPSRSTARNCRRRRMLAALNDLGRDNGIGRLDLVENRFVGMKSRGVYETPGGTILIVGAPRHRIDHARPRCRAPQGRVHAALCRADLQRLLVRARAR